MEILEGTGVAMEGYQWGGNMCLDAALGDILETCE